MDNLFEGGIAELEKIKEMLLEDSRQSMELDEARDALKSKEKEIDAENQQIEDRIQEVLKAKREAIAEPHNREVTQAEEILKESIQQRNTAKEVAVNKRINLETAGIHDQNVQLEFSVKTLFKNSDIPAFCRFPYYYSMYAPKSVKDYIIFVITALIAFVGIPIAVISLVDTTTIGKIFIYVGIVVFFCLIYLAVFFWTQPNRKRKTLELARPDIEKIQENKKEMKKLTRKIRNDKDESGYGLEALDTEIVRNRGVYDDAVARREEALRAFEEQIKPSVREEVAGARAEEMNRLLAEKGYLANDLERRTKEKEALDLTIKQNYTTYIGKRNMDPEKIDQLTEIIRSGRAGNILEALDVQKDDSKISSRLGDVADRIRQEEDADESTEVEVAKPDQPDEEK